jgi:hypothetical protein
MTPVTVLTHPDRARPLNRKHDLAPRPLTEQQRAEAYRIAKAKAKRDRRKAHHQHRSAE